MHKISIIIPVYNVEQYIRKCLDSVVNQTLKQIEIIVVNDGSTDNSFEICKEYAKIDERITLINIENSGVSIARNEGIKHATSEYIMFVDSDDWIEVNMCEALYRKIYKNNADICFCNNIKEYGNKVEYFDFHSKSEVIYSSEIKKEIILPLIEENDKKIIHKRDSFRGPCAKIYKRQIIIEKNIRFNPYLAIGEDLIFNIEYLSYCNNVVFDEGFLYHYRVNLGSATKRYRENPWRTYKDLLIILQEYLNSNFIEDEYINRFNKLKIKYLIISINNEMSRNNNKNYTERIGYIKSICEDKMINFVLNNYSKGTRGTKNKVMLFLLRNKIYWPFGL